MAAKAGEVARTTLVIATGNQTKLGRLSSALGMSPFFKAQALENAGVFNPDEKGLQYESDRAFLKANEAYKIVGQPSVGWDDGMYIAGSEFPGPNIKSSLGDNPLPQEIFSQYKGHILSLPEDKRKGYIKRAICVVDQEGKPYFTTKLIPFNFNEGGEFIEGRNPLDSLIIPQGFSHAFSEFTDEERRRYDTHLSESIDAIGAEINARNSGENTRRSIEMNGKVWVFSDPEMHLFRPEDEDGVGKLSGILGSNYNGLTPGWVARKYGTASEEQELDPNGFFTLRRGLLLIGQPGTPKAMLSWVTKRGGSLKTNTLRVDDEHQREGLGRKIKQEMLQMGEALGVRKMYCTTSRQNTAALTLNLDLGYKIEAEFPQHYHLEKDEVILGKVLRRDLDKPADTSTRMLIPGESATHTTVAPIDIEKDGAAFGELVSGSLAGWHENVGQDFITNTLKGALRGVEDVDGKGKFILVAHDGSGMLTGVAVLTLKMGGPAKIYPLIGTEEAQVELLENVVNTARILNSHVVYTFSPEWDGEQRRVLTERGFGERGLIESPYKPGANLIPWSMSIK